MTPSEAVIRRVQMVDGYTRMLTLNRDRIKRMSGDRSFSMGAAELQAMRKAELFTWRDDLKVAAIKAGTSLPSPVTMASDLMPASDGIYFFETPIDFEGSKWPCSAIAWSLWAGGYVAIWAYQATAGTTWSHHGPLSAYASFILKVGASADTESPTDWRTLSTDAEWDMKVASRHAVRFLVSSWLWLKQTVLLSARAQVSSQARKLSERISVSAVVRSVVLRRAASHSQESGTGGAEYSCQWLVRGHWRQQFYPSKNEHRPLWIEPYVKGPDDMPFRPPSETVFAVRR